MDTSTNPLPPDLEQLIQPRPSSVMKLIAAWDGLQVETQIDILTLLGRFSAAEFPRYLRDKINRKAFESRTAYIRYLAVRHYGGFGNKLDGDWQARIDSDPDPLVRHATSEFCLDEPEKFWALPHEARLLQVDSLRGIGYAELLANAIIYAIDNNTSKDRISELELHEVLADNLMNPEVIQHMKSLQYSNDAGIAIQNLRDINALRGLIPKVPPTIAKFLSNVLSKL